MNLRRTFATRLISKNVDIVEVQKLMGHASVATTGNYVRKDEENLRRRLKKQNSEPSRGMLLIAQDVLNNLGKIQLSWLSKVETSINVASPFIGYLSCQFYSKVNYLEKIVNLIIRIS